MKRFITYIYEYERGIRGRNVGFIRSDLRDNCSRMDIHIRGLDRFKGKCSVFLIIKEQPVTGIPAGEMILTQGTGHLQLTCFQNQIGETGYSVNQLQAVLLRYGNGKLLIGNLVSELSDEILHGNFHILEEEKEILPDILPDVTEPEPEEESKEERPAILESSVTETPSPSVRYERIEITDIRALPQQNHHLCNNSFLVHGFFNYHYLILKTIEEKDGSRRYLGVPGIYEQPERMMALLFGFPEFEAADSEKPADVSENFGYWMCLLAEA